MSINFSIAPFLLRRHLGDYGHHPKGDDSTHRPEHQGRPGHRNDRLQQVYLPVRLQRQEGHWSDPAQGYPALCSAARECQVSKTNMVVPAKLLPYFSHQRTFRLEKLLVYSDSVL